MKRIDLLFGIHNHQPIGNFEFVFEETYKNAYLPFIEVLENHPSIKIAIHFTGILLDWLIINKPGLIRKIKKMVARGQLEILTGGYYEPILCVIPEKDRIGQIKKLSDKIKKVFDYKPEGLWLAERVWEPTLPSTLSEVGVTYSILDDTHFKYAGLIDDQLNGYYITEELGKTIDLFPISRRLRYAIPFEDPDVTIEYLRSMATEAGNNMVVFADDGEKFGAWPNTYDHVYKARWLDRFFCALEENSSWINLLHFSQARKSTDPLGRIYLPTASYSEMMQWSLFPDAFKSYADFEHYLSENGIYEDVHVFVRGGFWRNFMAKYSEVDNMHKKMLRISDRLWNLPQSKQKKLKKAFDHLWAGQCNCPYWHGVFGGLYLSHLRDAIYQNLIQAEILIEREIVQSFPSIEMVDLNLDGKHDAIITTQYYNAHVNFGSGGTLTELDYKPLAKNILDTVTRREEGYHDKLKGAVVIGEAANRDETASIHDLVLAKEPNLISHLHYDFYERKSYLDHFLGDETTLNSFADSQYTEEGDFLKGTYVPVRKKSGEDSILISMQRKGNIWNKGKKEPVTVNKKLRFQNEESTIIAEYTLINHSQRILDLWFGIEFNFGLQAGHAEDRFYFNEIGPLEDKYLDSVGSMENANFLGLVDQWRQLDIRLRMNKKSTIWRFPIETISLSEGGFEKVYQSSVVFPNWKIRLEKKWQVKIIQEFSMISS